MSGLYRHQLLAIRSMLKSPQENKIQEAYDLLFELVFEHSNNIEFLDELLKITKEKPELNQELEKRISILSLKQRKKLVELQVKLGITLSIEPNRNTNSTHRQKVLKKRATPIKHQKIKRRNPKIFISYSHDNERFKDELIKILAPLQNQKIIEIWDDRRIKPGEEWYKAIENAMNDCNIALLLVSKEFLNSRFINEVEIKKLLRRRRNKGLNVVPIIIKACMWQDVDVLKDLQALPTDGEPIANTKSTSGRDRIWTDIGRAIKSILE